MIKIALALIALLATVPAFAQGGHHEGGHGGGGHERHMDGGHEHDGDHGMDRRGHRDHDDDDNGVVVVPLPEDPCVDARMHSRTWREENGCY
jgi:hypothetical protein